MKKGPFIFLLIFCALLCVMIGIFIGRRTSASFYTVPNPAEVQTADNDTVPAAPALGRIDINQATLEDLDSLPGIGETIAMRIIDYREKNGPFTTVDDLENVEGIGKKRLDSIREFITVGG